MTQTLLIQKKSEPKAPLVPYRNNNVQLQKLNGLVPEKDLEKIKDCGRRLLALKCTESKCRKYRFFPIRCKKRACPYCGIRLRRRNFKKYAEILSIPPYNKLARSIYDTGLRFITITVKSSPSLEEAYKSITRNTWKLERSKWFKNNIIGGLGSTEFVYNYETNTWHIHRHIIVFSKYIPMKHKEGQDSKFVKLWKKITKESCYIHVERIRNLKGTLNYILNYSLKLPENFEGEIYKEYYQFSKHKNLTFMIKKFRSFRIVKQKRELKCDETDCNGDLKFQAIISYSDYLRVTNRKPPDD